MSLFDLFIGLGSLIVFKLDAKLDLNSKPRRSHNRKVAQCTLTILKGQNLRDRKLLQLFLRHGSRRIHPINLPPHSPHNIVLVQRPDQLTHVTEYAQVEHVDHCEA